MHICGFFIIFAIEYKNIQPIKTRYLCYIDLQVRKIIRTFAAEYIFLFMKKLLLLLALCLTTVAYSQSPDRLNASSPYSLALHAGYGHNLTYGTFANFDLDAQMPINQHFEMETNLRASTANTYTLGVQLRPKFALPVGEMFLEDRVMANFIARDGFNQYIHALSLGYRMQYVSVQVGMYTRLMMPIPYEHRTGDELICEPFDAIYRVEVRVRPETSPWNISLALSNADDYQIERMWQPMFYLGGWYDIDDHWRVQLTGKLKLAGMFHLNAHYYASELRFGAEYRF